MKALSTIALACALGCTGCLDVAGYGPTRFSGQVVDSITKAPIANAQLRMMPYWNSAWLTTGTTGSDGRFVATASRLSLFPPSSDELWTDARIEVVAEGYQTKTLSELDLTKSQSSNIAVYLIHR